MSHNIYTACTGYTTNLLSRLLLTSALCSQRVVSETFHSQVLFLKRAQVPPQTTTLMTDVLPGSPAASTHGLQCSSVIPSKTVPVTTVHTPAFSSAAAFCPTIQSLALQKACVSSPYKMRRRASKYRSAMGIPQFLAELMQKQTVTCALHNFKH